MIYIAGLSYKFIGTVLLILIPITVIFLGIVVQPDQKLLKDYQQKRICLLYTSIEALQKNAVSIVILHNHPSGDPTPSRNDMLTTKRIMDAGKLIGIELLDHVIIGNNCYVSFRESGIL